MRTRPWRRRQSRRRMRASSTAATMPANDQVEIRRDLLEHRSAAGDGSAHMGKRFVASRRDRRRGLRFAGRPRSSRAMTAPAPAPRLPVPPAATRAYQGLTSSQKCRPIIACDHATTRVANCQHAIPRRADKQGPKNIGVIADSRSRKHRAKYGCRRRGGRAGSAPRSRAAPEPIRWRAGAMCAAATGTRAPV